MDITHGHGHGNSKQLVLSVYLTRIVPYLLSYLSDPSEALRDSFTTGIYIYLHIHIQSY